MYVCVCVCVYLWLPDRPCLPTLNCFCENFQNIMEGFFKKLLCFFWYNNFRYSSGKESFASFVPFNLIKMV